MVVSKISTDSELKADATRVINFSASPSANQHLQTTIYTGGIRLPRLIGDLQLFGKPTAEVEIAGKANSDIALNELLSAVNNIDVTADKFHGTFKDYLCSQKLYPIGDIETVMSGSYFVNELIQSGNLYASVDEGVYTGDYDLQGGISNILSDDDSTFITPSAIQTEGIFRYKCQVAKPITAEHSSLVIRATAPIENRVSQTPPQYTLNNMKLEDPAGNLIIKYEDIVVRGDADFSTGTNKNWATYVAQPTENRFALNTWDDLFPKLNDDSGYTLNIDVTVHDFDDPFDEGFDFGFEENDLGYDPTVIGDDDYLGIGASPLGTTFQGYINPNNSIRISAIEICNSGAYDVRVGQKFNMLLEVEPTGTRLQREIKPTQFKLATFDTGIYPTSSSVWQDGTSTYTNETTTGASKLLDVLTNEATGDYINLQSTFGVVDSGKLILCLLYTSPSPRD